MDAPLSKNSARSKVIYNVLEKVWVMSVDGGLDHSQVKDFATLLQLAVNQQHAPVSSSVLSRRLKKLRVNFRSKRSFFILSSQIHTL